MDSFGRIEMETPKHETEDESREAADGDRADEHLNVTKTVPQPEAQPEQSDNSYDEDDEAMIRRRLESLGYL